ncbi:hypothetical protein DEI98_09240 [Curtobacterium sp. MCLR17_034]|nr:hypothetical protein DEI98_09240 [Curtobacterium sp. MCLR17_034]
MMAGPAHAATESTTAAMDSEKESVSHMGGTLDPETYSGALLVATPEGDEVPVMVKSGEAPEAIARIRTQAVDGTLATSREMSAAAVSCGVFVNAIASPFGYAVSPQGCAVAGYRGYQREYRWNNTSDVELCAQGKGFVNNGTTEVYQSTGCTSGAYSVSWGNSLAYTQMKGMSLSGVTGAAYQFRA